MPIIYTIFIMFKVVVSLLKEILNLSIFYVIILVVFVTIEVPEN